MSRALGVVLIMLLWLAWPQRVPQALADAGQLDPSFGVGGKVVTDVGGPGHPDTAYAVALQPDGRIVVAGQSYGFGVVRYLPDGELDPSFSADGKTRVHFGRRTPDRATALMVQPDGAIVVTGTTWDDDQVQCPAAFAVVRFTSSGKLDRTFGVNGKVTTDFGAYCVHAAGAALQPDGKIVVAGTLDPDMGRFSQVALARYDTDGTLDSTFGTEGTVVTSLMPNAIFTAANAVALQSDGKILVVGGVQGQRGGTKLGVVRYEPDGSLDAGFGNGGIRLIKNAYGTDAAVQEDGDILVTSGFALLRLDPNGLKDKGFGVDGWASVAFAQNTLNAAVAVAPNGQIVVGGSEARASGNGTRFALARFNADGTLDTSFSHDGKLTSGIPGSKGWDSGTDVAVQPDGNILLVGQTLGVDTDFAVLRYLGT